jgi:hypothetical protein
MPIQSPLACARSWPSAARGREAPLSVTAADGADGAEANAVFWDSPPMRSASRADVREGRTVSSIRIRAILENTVCTVSSVRDHGPRAQDTLAAGR